MAFVSVIDKADRVGKFSSEILSGARVPVDAQEITFRSNVRTPDLEDAELDFTVSVFVSDDGVSWKHECGFGYEGKKFSPGRADPVPWMRCQGASLDSFKGKFVRVEIDSKVSKSVGVEVEVL